MGGGRRGGGDLGEVIERIRVAEGKTLRGNAGGGLGASRARRGLVAGFFLGLSFVLVPDALAQRTEFRQGWNKFSPQDDITLGKRAATDAEKQLPLCNAPRVDAYLAELGARLAQKLP